MRNAAGANPSGSAQWKNINGFGTSDCCRGYSEHLQERVSHTNHFIPHFVHFKEMLHLITSA